MIFDLANRFARSKQLLSCHHYYYDSMRTNLKLAGFALFARSSYFNMIGRGKGGKEKGKGLSKCNRPSLVG